MSIVGELLNLQPPAWMAAAVCSTTDPEAFFPERGSSTSEAKRVCRGCPEKTRKQCLQYALERDERFGVWGGYSERERRRLQRGEVFPPAFKYPKPREVKFKTCQCCGDDFESSHGKAKFCSQECYREFSNARRRTAA